MNKAIEQQILDELLQGEFKKIKNRNIPLAWESYPYPESNTWQDKETITLKKKYRMPIFSMSDTLGWVETGMWDKIYLNRRYKNWLKRNLQILKYILRHELLHIKLERGDLDPIFQRELKKRKMHLRILDLLIQLESEGIKIK